MKGRQRTRLISYLSTGQVFRENIAIIATAPAVQRVVKEYDELLLNILENMYKQTESLTHCAKDKKELRKKLVAHTVRLSGLGYIYGDDKKDYVLMTHFSRSYTAIFRKHDTSVGATCRYLYNELMKIKDSWKDYSIKKKDVEELFELIEQFTKVISAPHSLIKHRTTHTKNLKDNLDAAGSLLKNRMNRVMASFKHYPEFYKAYYASCKHVKYDKPKIVLEEKINEFYTSPRVPKRRAKKIIAQHVEVKVLE